MKHRQIEKHSMYKKMLVFFSNPAYSSVWANFKRLTDEIAKFIALNKTLENYILQHYEDVQGINSLKYKAFDTMVTRVVKFAKKGYVWAVDNTNEALMQVFSIQKTDLTHMQENKAYATVKNIRTELNANIASMETVNLKPADITGLDAAIKAYEDTLGVSGAAKSHKTSGTLGIADILHPIDESLELIDNLMDSEYADSHEGMVKEYWLNRNIERMATHHNGIRALITDGVTGLPLEGALLSVNDKTATLDIDGIAEIIKIKTGTFMAAISRANYVTQQVKTVVKRGKITEIEVNLAKSI